MLKRCLLYTIVFFLLAGCASLNERWDEPLILENKIEKERRQAMKSWSLSGRLSLRDSKRSELSLIKWRHNEVVDLWVLSSLIGGTIAEISYTKGIAYIKEPKKSLKALSNQTLRETFGFVPPLQHLSYWVRGLPDSEGESNALEGEEYTIKGFEQHGWTVNLARYGREDGVVLPSKIVISKDGLKITIVVDKWKIE